MRFSSLRSFCSLAPGYQSRLIVRPALSKLHSKMDYASMPSMSSNQTSLKKVLTPKLYDQLHSYWFKGHAPEFLTPKPDKVKAWFMKDEANDDYCRSVISVRLVQILQ